MCIIPGLGGGGGAERSLGSMLPFWLESIELHLVTLSNRPTLVDDLGHPGLTHTRVLSSGRGDLIRQIVQLVRRDRPTLVHPTLFDADIAGRIAGTLTGTPVSASLVNVNYGPEQLSVPGQRVVTLRAAQLAEAASSRTVSRFHALTEHVADTMGRRLLIRRSKIDVIPRGRDVDELGVRSAERSAAVRAGLGVTDAPLVVATARHEWQKGLDVLVRATPAIRAGAPGAQVLIGGRTGQQTRKLEALVDELGLADVVRFIGPRADVPDLMCAADVYCVPSRWEGFGGILIEAMALEVPTVSTSIGPIREVAGPDPWLRLVTPDRPDELARSVLDALADVDGSAAMARRGRRRFLEHYTAEAVAAQMLDFFSRAVDESRRG